MIVVVRVDYYHLINIIHHYYFIEFKKKTNYSIIRTRVVCFISQLILNHETNTQKKNQPPHSTGMQRTTITHLGSTHLLSRCVRDNLCVSRNLPTFTVITPAFMSKNSLRGIWLRAKHFFFLFFLLPVLLLWNGHICKLRPSTFRPMYSLSLWSLWSFVHTA